MDPDLNPGGPKTRGSGGSGFGSATLEVANLLFIAVNYFLFRRDVPHASCVRGQGYPLRLHASKTGSIQHCIPHYTSFLMFLCSSNLSWVDRITNSVNKHSFHSIPVYIVDFERKNIR
jgi:hypothetical protein